ncbi:LA2681 family HEPN domain-containing protein [Planococcus sp. S3-L1]|uniref:LA2681 family HEPN domain-containing protein n=1 Tax=Planococcus sp. S3-L1 TaxID=3046200 RepID=UPI0024B9CFCA|nr:LA2681 family HEPN domain-containing protein [Planococcus sp. S3-L1]MDJ0332585.1 LA2681 family HEPN domain-containing protein [Planococcus sp. S3-L1]
MSTLHEIAQSDDYGQFELKEVYQAAQHLLQEFQKSRNEPEKLQNVIDHLKKRLDGQAAYPLAILLETSQLGVQHQLQKDWNSPMKQRQLFLFESVYAQFRGKVPPTIWNQICLNYAEALIYIGRSLDGLHVLEQMTEAENDASYERQDAERGWGLLFYSTFLRGKEQKAEALHLSRDLLRDGLEKITNVNGRALYADRLKLAVKMLEDIGPIDLTGNYKPNFFDGREREYRDWCAEHRLLLNDNNEIDPKGTMKVDTLNYRHKKADDKERGLFLETFMDSMVSEFTVLRWNLFEALEQEPSSERNEQLKTVYRQAFSLFSKMAQFISSYYELDMKNSRAGMQRIWFEDEDPKNPLKPFIRDTKNGALKALFWHSKELFGYEQSKVQNIATVRALLLRDQMERSFVDVITKKEEVAQTGELRKHQMTQAELERLSMTTAFKARNALMYLGFALGIEKK